DLDIALAWGDGSDAPHVERVADLPIQWIGRPGWAGVGSLGGEPVPLAAITSPCVLRSAAVDAMDAAGLPWRLAFTSPNLSGLLEAAAGGLGITVRTTFDFAQKR